MCESNIPDDFPYDAILIDTSIYKQYALKFDKGLLKTLSQFKSGPVKLLMPEIILCEVKKHLKAEIQKVVSKVSTVVRDIEEYSLVDQKDVVKFDALKSIDIEKIVNEQLDDFLEKTGAEVIDCGSLINVSDLLGKYFSGSPPFGEGSKKSEFPDAIVLYGIEKWAKERDVLVLVISNDGDWKSYGEKSECIEYTDDLEKALVSFNAKLPFLLVLRQIKDLIEREDKVFLNKINSLLHVSDRVNYPDAESDLYLELDGYSFDIESFNFTSDKLQIVQMDSDLLVIKANIDVLIKANADFSLSAYDSIDREYVSFSSCHKIIDVEHNTNVLLTFEGEINAEQSIDNLELTDVEVLEALYKLDFGWIEPHFD